MSLLFAAVSAWPYTAWPLNFVLCSGGFSNILYAFGLGYGLSMTASAATAAVLASADTPLTGLPATACALYLAYGIRLASFLLRRQHCASYEKRLQQVQARSDAMPTVARGLIVAGVSFSQALYALPLRAATLVSAGGSWLPSFLAIRMQWAGVALAAFGLLLETVADEQKLAAKRRCADAPVTEGLYTMCRHPNYLGEICFHAGIIGLAAGAETLPQLCGALIAPIFMIATMLGAARRLDRSGEERYGDDESWRRWRDATPSLLPWGAMGGRNKEA